VRRRHPKQGDDRVADELLDVAAVPLECRGHGAEVAVHHLPHGLGVELLAELRRPGHVRENTVTTRRDAATSSSRRTGAPQAGQNLARAGSGSPHLAHVASTRAASP
jgi:hypothetical protein